VVVGVWHVRNLIDLVWLVMERFLYVLLIGAGVEEFAFEQGVELVLCKYFFIECCW
jgi:Asparaginase